MVGSSPAVGTSIIKGLASARPFFVYKSTVDLQSRRLSCVGLACWRDFHSSYAYVVSLASLKSNQMIKARRQVQAEYPSNDLPGRRYVFEHEQGVLTCHDL